MTKITDDEAGRLAEAAARVQRLERSRDLCPKWDIPRALCAHCGPVRPPTVDERAEAVVQRAEDLRAGRATPHVDGKPVPEMARVVTMPAYTEPRLPDGVVPVALNVDRSHYTMHDYVIELAEATAKTEPRTRLVHNADGTTTSVTEQHRTESASLIDQLEAAIETGGSTGGGSSTESGLPLALAAFDTYTSIDRGITTWRRQLGLVDRTAPPLEPGPALKNLQAGALSMKCARPKGMHTRTRDVEDDERWRTTWCCRYHHLEHDVRSWWTQARITTGWDAQHWRPSNTCPLCSARGSLRIERDASAAMCTECRSTWEGDAQIKLLAAHIRSENGEKPDDATSSQVWSTG